MVLNRKPHFPCYQTVSNLYFFSLNKIWFLFQFYSNLLIFLMSSHLSSCLTCWHCRLSCQNSHKNVQSANKLKSVIAINERYKATWLQHTCISKCILVACVRHDIYPIWYQISEQAVFSLVTMQFLGNPTLLNWSRDIFTSPFETLNPSTSRDSKWQFLEIYGFTWKLN